MLTKKNIFLSFNQFVLYLQFLGSREAPMSHILNTTPVSFQPSDYPLFCGICLRTFSSHGPKNVHETRCRRRPYKRPEPFVLLERLTLPYEVLVGQEAKTERIESDDCGEEEDDKENKVSNSKDEFSQVVDDEINVIESLATKAAEDKPIIVDDEDEEVTFSRASNNEDKDSGFGNADASEVESTNEDGGPASSGRKSKRKGGLKRSRPVTPVKSGAPSSGGSPEEKRKKASTDDEKTPSPKIARNNSSLPVKPKLTRSKAK